MYLGLPLGASPRLKKTWKPVIEKCRVRLASWRRRFLSFGGRLTLIKSMLSSLPIYYLSIFKLPVSVAKVIERIQANFLWGGSELKRKAHLVSWLEATRSKENGGLGIGRIKVVNDCLLAKWWWRFGAESNTLWKRILCSRLFSLSTENEVSLRLVVQRNEVSPRWSFRFRRRLLGWETDEFSRLITFLDQNLVGLSDREDGLGWLASSFGEFSVSSLYSLVVPSSSLVVTKLIWNNFSPPKVQFLGWNEKVFCERQMHLEELCELIKTRIALWAKSYSKDCCYLVQQIICNIQKIRLGL
ncbi:hypothetical protein ACSBR1_015362 [Camellia fascicularis]